MNINRKYFVMSMFITIFILFIFDSEPKIIVKHPSPNDEISDLYVDDRGVHYRYHRKEIK